MQIKIVALYPVALEGYETLPDLRRRQLRDGSVISVVDCDIESIAGRSFARPRHIVPEGHPPPTFKAQLTMLRSQTRKSGVAVLAQPASHSGLDFEGRVLAPSYTDHTRVIFEFHDAEVFYLGADDSVEVRLIVIERRSGEVGTSTLARFDARYFGILDKCRRHVAGSLELYPVRQAFGYRTARIPSGNVELTFGARSTETVKPIPFDREGTLVITPASTVPESEDSLSLEGDSNPELISDPPVSAP